MQPTAGVPVGFVADVATMTTTIRRIPAYNAAICYDFSKGVRGKHAAKYAGRTNVVVLEPDVAREFERLSKLMKLCAPFLNC